MKNDLFSDIKTEILNYGRYSLEIEKQREESLLQQAGHMLSAFAFSTAALYILMPIFLNDIDFLEDNFVIFWISIISLFLIISLLFAIFAMWRWKYWAMPNIETLYSSIKSNPKQYIENKNAIFADWKFAYTEMYKSLEKLNERRGILIKISMWSFIIAIALVFSSVINALIIIY